MQRYRQVLSVFMEFVKTRPVRQRIRGLPSARVAAEILPHVIPEPTLSFEVVERKRVGIKTLCLKNVRASYTVCVPEEYFRPLRTVKGLVAALEKIKGLTVTRAIKTPDGYELNFEHPVKNPPHFRAGAGGVELISQYLKAEMGVPGIILDLPPTPIIYKRK